MTEHARTAKCKLALEVLTLAWYLYCCEMFVDLHLKWVASWPFFPLLFTLYAGVGHISAAIFPVSINTWRLCHQLYEWPCEIRFRGNLSGQIFHSHSVLETDGIVTELLVPEHHVMVFDRSALLLIWHSICFPGIGWQQNWLEFSAVINQHPNTFPLVAVIKVVPYWS